MSRVARTVPRTEPETFDRVPAARGAYGTSNSRIRQPAAAGAEQQLQRVAEGPVGDAEVEQGRAAGHPDRAEVVHRYAPAPQQRRRPGALPARACHGQTPARVTGRRRPTARSAVPAGTGAARPGSSPGSNEPSASSTQTSSASGGLQPGVHGGAVARGGARAPPGRRARRRPRASRRWSRCPPRSPRYPGGSPASTPGRAAASSRQGSTTSIRCRHTGDARTADRPGSGTDRRGYGTLTPQRFPTRPVTSRSRRFGRRRRAVAVPSGRHEPPADRRPLPPARAPARRSRPT